MQRTTKEQREFYLDVNDVMEELDVTRRQLRHWEEKGLIVPEIGRNRYTPKDVEQLRLIRRLVVDEGFPVEVVRRLFEKQLWNDRFFDEDVSDRARSGDLTNQVLDIDSGALVTREEMFGRLWNEFLGDGDARELETRLLQLTLVYFRELRSQSRTPLGYLGVVEEILTRLQELSRVARIEAVYDNPDNSPPTGVQLRPLMPGETEEMVAEAKTLVLQHEGVLTELEEADNDLFRRGRFHGKPHRKHRLSPISDITDWAFDK